MASRIYQKDLVIIELGTVFSKVAYKYASSSNLSLKLWSADELILLDYIPTSILIQPDCKTVEGFGYEAETKYNVLKANKSESEYFYFKGLNDLISLKTYVQDTQLEDESGKCLPASDVLSVLIKMITNEALCETKGRRIALVIILPTGTTLAFTKLIKDAVTKTGMDDKGFIFLPNADAISQWFQKEKLFLPQQEWLTVITKADSVELIVYKTELDGRIKILKTIRQDNWGFAIVFKQFENLLVDLFGKDEYDSFKLKFNEEWVNLQRQFMSKLTNQIREDIRDTTVNVYKPLGLHVNSRVFTCHSANVRVIGDKIRIPVDVFRSFYDELVQAVSLHIEAEALSYDQIVMLGHFADDVNFKDKMSSLFECASMTVPQTAGLSSLNGALAAAQTAGILKGYNQPLVVASLDFGTTYSGWARSYSHEYHESPTKAFAKTWQSETILTEKTPTCVLIEKDGKTLKAFGYEAIRQHRALMLNGEEKSCYFFQNFKMALYKPFGEKLYKNMKINDELGRPLLAMDVFGVSIKFLKDDFLQNCKKEFLGELLDSDVHWVITVPAIWSDAAKQFMREAAKQAGISRKQLTLALEPEAASIYCRNLQVDARVDRLGEQTSASTFTPGTKYMVLDAGGGTIDTTIHEVIDTDSIKEIHAASGGGWGGMTVNRAFEDLMRSLFGEETYTEFCKNEIEDHIELLREFEIKKRAVSPVDDTPIRIVIPVSLIALYKNKTGHSFENRLSISDYSNDIKVVSNKASLSANIARSLFKCSTDKVICHMKETLKKAEVNAILMVGGFSDSPMLQHEISSHFPDVATVIPKEAVASIMKGALIFGHMPLQLKERVLKYTYGIKTQRDFREGIDPESKLLKTDSGVNCMDVFDKHVQINQRVIVGEPQTERIYSPINKTQRIILFEIYASKLEDPQFTDENCMYLGNMLLDLIDFNGDLRRAVKVSMTFSDTEMIVEAEDETTGEETHVSLNFLG